MTVTFNTQVSSTMTDDFGTTFDDILNTIQTEKVALKTFLKQSPKQYPTSHWWVTRVYHTTSEGQPIKWVPSDYACYGTMADVENGFIEWVDYLSKNTSISGYKICTMQLDMLNGTSVVSSNFSKEHFQPKEKIFINGPKKKPFPAKAAKHFGV